MGSNLLDTKMVDYSKLRKSKNIEDRRAPRNYNRDIEANRSDQPYRNAVKTTQGGRVVVDSALSNYAHAGDRFDREFNRREMRYQTASRKKK